MARSRVIVTTRTDQGQLRAVLVGPQSLAQQTVGRVSRRTVAEAKQAAPVRTGVLRNSITTAAQPTVTGMRVVQDVVATAPYARYVHDGTRPHVIRPRSATVLAFPGRSGTCSRASVNHPGTRPRPFLKNGLRRAAEREGFEVRDR